MSGNVLSTMQLKNGLCLSCIDKSRKIAADRWYIDIVARIEITVEEKWFVNSSVDELNVDDIRHVLGDRTVFEKTYERNFVSDDVKQNVVDDICGRIVNVADQYFSHADFAARYLIKCYGEKLKKRH